MFLFCDLEVLWIYVAFLTLVGLDWIGFKSIYEESVGYLENLKSTIVCFKTASKVGQIKRNVYFTNL